MTLPLALQLYSVRVDMERDYRQTLERVAKLGFQGVEFAGFFDIPAHEMKKTLSDNNLLVAGSHTSYEQLTTHLDEVMEYNHILGNKNIICPYCEFPDQNTLDSIIEQFQMIGTRLKKEGFSFHYHNHKHEFAKLSGEFVFDLLFSSLLDAAILSPELDVYWAYCGGVDPVTYINKYADSIELLHLKDGTKEKDTSIGYGEVAIKDVLSAAQNTNIKWMIVEDETPYPESFFSVERGIHYLRVIDKADHAQHAAQK